MTRFRLDRKKSGHSGLSGDEERGRNRKCLWNRKEISFDEVHKIIPNLRLKFLQIPLDLVTKFLVSGLKAPIRRRRNANSKTRSSLALREKRFPSRSTSPLPGMKFKEVRFIKEAQKISIAFLMVEKDFKIRFLPLGSKICHRITSQQPQKPL